MIPKQVIVKRIQVTFREWVYGNHISDLDFFAPKGLLLVSEGEAVHDSCSRNVIVTATYGTLAQVAASVGVNYFPAR